GRAQARSGRALRRARRPDGASDPDRVPAARPPARRTRRRSPPAGARPRGLAVRRGRAREHARRVRGPAAQEAGDARRPGDRHRPRRGLQAGMSRLGLKRRLLVAVLLAVAVGLGGLLAGFNILLANQLDANANDLVRARADAELNLLRPSHGGVVVGEAPGAAPDAPVWVFSRGKLIEGPRVGRTTPFEATEAARHVRTVIKGD